MLICLIESFDLYQLAGGGVWAGKVEMGRVCVLLVVAVFGEVARWESALQNLWNLCLILAMATSVGANLPGLHCAKCAESNRGFQVDTKRKIGVGPICLLERSEYPRV